MARPQFCYVDMDGVLVDFVRASIAHHKLPLDPHDIPWEYFSPFMSAQEFYAPMGLDFWANLDWTPDGKELLAVVENYFPKDHIFLLTSPVETPGCYDGKRAWVRKHIPHYVRRFTAVNEKHGQSGPERALVDDHDHNVESFGKLGGHGVLVPRSWNKEAHLKDSPVERVAARLDTLMVG